MKFWLERQRHEASRMSPATAADFEQIYERVGQHVIASRRAEHDA